MRKSGKLRHEQTLALIAGYEAIGLSSDRCCKFLKDMECRLSRSKALSKGQRKFLDDLIDQGVPQLKNQARVDEILVAAKVDGMQREAASTLSDFAFKVGKGWSLSEKQEKFLATLLVKAEDLRLNGRFRPSPEVTKQLEIARELCKAKNDWYWQNRPGTAKAHRKVSDWLDWSYKTAAQEEITEFNGRELELADEPHIDEWACEKMLNAVKKALEELRNPRHLESSMCWHRIPSGTSQCVLIAGPPVVRRGTITYPCLADGKLMEIGTDHLKKRR